jgi:hypothetical protein
MNNFRLQVDTETNEQELIKIILKRVYGYSQVHLATKYSNPDKIMILTTFRQNRKTLDKETTIEKHKNICILIIT